MFMNLEKKLAQRKKMGNFRQLEITQPLIDFSSNDYLGLARSSLLREAVIQEWEMRASLRNKLGSTGSRLLTGNSHYAEDLEKWIAAFHGYEAGLLFNCGYMANMGLLSIVAGQEDSIFFDMGVHASIHDGIRLSRARAYAFRHNDLEHLENRLKNCSLKGNRFIAVESIYSTDGLQSQIIELCELAKKYDAHLIVDEAHAVGVCGPQGRGLIAEYNLTSKVFAQVTTFGKALGVHGAIVLGRDILKQALINFATSYIYTTALPFQALAAIQCSYRQFPKQDKERMHLKHLIHLFCKIFPARSKTHIQTVHVQGNAAAKRLSQRLKSKGLDARPLLSPTVQRGHEVLRICLHAFNTEEELASLISCLQQEGES